MRPFVVAAAVAVSESVVEGLVLRMSKCQAERKLSKRGKCGQKKSKLHSFVDWSMRGKCFPL